MFGQNFEEGNFVEHRISRNDHTTTSTSKKDLFTHFINKYGTLHYDKYRLSDYQQGPTV